MTAMKSPVVKRSIVIAGHKTSVSLEDAFWESLKEIAAARDGLRLIRMVMVSSVIRMRHFVRSRGESSHTCPRTGHLPLCGTQVSGGDLAC